MTVFNNVRLLGHGTQRKFLIAVFIVLFLFLTACHAPWAAYTHVDLRSSLPQEDCFLCGETADSLSAQDCNGDNVGIINLNTLDVMCIEINCGDAQGEIPLQVECSMWAADGSRVYSMAYPEKGYALVQIEDAAHSVDTAFIQTHLCQSCLDMLNALEFDGTAPSEYGVVSLPDKTLRPLTQSTS